MEIPNEVEPVTSQEGSKMNIRDFTDVVIDKTNEMTFLSPKLPKFSYRGSKTPGQILPKSKKSSISNKVPGYSLKSNIASNVKNNWQRSNTTITKFP